MNESRTIVGVMTGTSLDGIDATVIQVEGHGLNLRPELIEVASGPLGPAAHPLRAWSNGESLPAAVIAAAATDLGRACLATIATLEKARSVDLAGVHGQTVFHRPPYSLQLLDPAPLARGLQCPVLFDFRGGDLAAGGQGAPITPLADWMMYRDLVPTTVINLGGFCNLTNLPSRDGTIHSITAADICPCNHLLDELARQRLGVPFDRGGRVAVQGVPNAAAVDRITAVLRRLSSDHRSLGTGDESLALVEMVRRLPTPDALATMADALASVIAAAIPRTPRRVVVAGGGSRNRALLESLSRSHDGPLESSDAVGIPVTAREAMAIAVLTALADDGVPFTLPQVTGRTESTSFDGCWCFPRGIVNADAVRGTIP